jgi:hypothetical protein
MATKKLGKSVLVSREPQEFLRRFAHGSTSASRIIASLAACLGRAFGEDRRHRATP